MRLTPFDKRAMMLSNLDIGRSMSAFSIKTVIRKSNVFDFSQKDAG